MIHVGDFQFRVTVTSVSDDGVELRSIETTVPANNLEEALEKAAQVPLQDWLSDPLDASDHRNRKLHRALGDSEGLVLVYHEGTDDWHPHWCKRPCLQGSPLEYWAQDGEMRFA